ncbi:MAG TPA: rhomboid family intramembrane serine protease [Haliangium sp.]|nr:rhomboid family intramembrane serine protease [Haliangium sp.]
MFIPIGDEPNARTFPVINYALIAVNVAVFALISLPLMAQPVDSRDPMVQALLHELARQHPDLDPYTLLHELRQLSAYDVFLMRWGYRAAEPSLVTLITSMFLHGGWLHIIGNMLFLWIYGDNVEHRLGRVGYLGAYLASGVAATLGYAAVLPGSAGYTPLVGASGAISGVLGCYFVWFPRNRVRLLIALLPFYVDVWRVNARVVLGVYVVIDNLLPFLLADSGASGVAHGAHLGGFLAGAAGAVVLDRLNDQGQRRAGTGDGTTARALLGIGLGLLERGDPARAYQYLTRVLAMNAEPEVEERARQAMEAIAGQQKLQVRSRRWPPR